MWVWGNAKEHETETLGVARAALQGKAQRDLLEEAAKTLLTSGQSDRVGAWVEVTDNADSGGPNSFRGIVQDKDGDATPAAWSRLSPQHSLPTEVVVSLQPVQHDVNDSAEAPLIGALIEMRRALWVPVVVHAQLRGVLLAASRRKQVHLPRALLESVAAELALTMELEDERRLGRHRDQDLHRVQTIFAGAELPSDILAGIVKDCTQKREYEFEPNALFAAIGCLTDPPRTGKSPIDPQARSMRFAWQSGGAPWIRTLESEHVSSVWRRALESHRVAGSDLGIVSPNRGGACIVAWPLEAGGEALGALVAGIRGSTASVVALERLELSAALASSALLQLKRSEQAAAVESHHQAVLAALKNPPARSEEGRTEDGLAELLNVIEWLEEGVVLFGQSQEIRAINSRFAQIVGLTPEEFRRVKTLDDLVAALGARTADERHFAENWNSLRLSSDTALREELHLVRPVPRLLERAARPILDEKGSLIGRVEIYRDLTAQRVFQSKLLQTEKLAGLGQTVTGVAHELSNPLTSILGYAQRLLLRRDAIGNSQEVRQIFQEAERASAILRHLLLSARESQPERRRVALNQVVSRSLELQRFSGLPGNIRVQLDLDPVLPFVQGDVGQLQQVLVNLIANARHAIEEQGKGGTISLKTRRIGEKRVLLEVSDDGPGIPKAIQARIFDPFFTTKPAGIGTGLGLSIVLGIVREHGGKLHLISDIGQGTIFSIEFPATTPMEMSLPATRSGPPVQPRFEALPAPESVETVHAGAALRAWAGTRVLVIEDEPTVAQLIADVLQDEGLHVDVLFNAREALDRAARVTYALVICDMKMPELDGEHFYRTLAAANNPLCGRFLFVTGDVLAAHTRDFLRRNHLPHVAKPFRVEELTEKVRSLLEATSPLEPVHAPTKRNAARK